MVERLHEFLHTNGKQIMGQMVTSMVSGLTEQVAEIAEAQEVTDGKLECVGTAISEVRARLTAAESRENERGAKLAKRIEALQAAIELMREYGWARRVVSRAAGQG